jgi:hypothetical protein
MFYFCVQYSVGLTEYVWEGHFANVMGAQFSPLTTTFLALYKKE